MLNMTRAADDTRLLPVRAASVLAPPTLDVPLPPTALLGPLEVTFTGVAELVLDASLAGLLLSSTGALLTASLLAFGLILKSEGSNLSGNEMEAHPSEPVISKSNLAYLC